MKPIKEALEDLQLKDLWMEAGFLAFIIVYLINLFVGTQTNKRIAFAWAHEFSTEGSILERNFSHLGICECSTVQHFKYREEQLHEDLLPHLRSAAWLHTSESMHIAHLSIPQQSHSHSWLHGLEVCTMHACLHFGTRHNGRGLA